jgi:hypothetical protein
LRVTATVAKTDVGVTVIAASLQGADGAFSDVREIPLSVTTGKNRH